MREAKLHVKRSFFSDAKLRFAQFNLAYSWYFELKSRSEASRQKELELLKPTPIRLSRPASVLKVITIFKRQRSWKERRKEACASRREQRTGGRYWRECSGFYDEPSVVPEVEAEAALQNWAWKYVHRQSRRRPESGLLMMINALEKNLR